MTSSKYNMFDLMLAALVIAGGLSLAAVLVFASPSVRGVDRGQGVVVADHGVDDTHGVFTVEYLFDDEVLRTKIEAGKLTEIGDTVTIWVKGDGSLDKGSVLTGPVAVLGIVAGFGMAAFGALVVGFTVLDGRSQSAQRAAREQRYQSSPAPAYSLWD